MEDRYMLNLTPILFFPLKIRRTFLILPFFIVFGIILIPIFVFMFALISAPDEYAMAVIALIFIVFSILIWLPAIIISLIKFYKFAAKKENSPFRLIPEAPEGTLFKLPISIDFESIPRVIIYRILTQDEIAKSLSSSIIPTLNADNTTAQDTFKITELMVNQNHKVCMIPKLNSGLLLSTFGLASPRMQQSICWIVFTGDTFDAFMNEFNKHDNKVKTKKLSDIEAKYIIDGFATHGL